MNKTCTILGFVTALLMGGPAFPHERPDYSCEPRLEHSEVVENLVEEAVGFESSLVDLESRCYGQRCLWEAQVLRSEFNNYIEDLLSRNCEPSELIRRFEQLSTREMRLRASAFSPLPPVAQPTRPPRRSILNFIENAANLPVNAPVELNNPHSSIRNVTFLAGVLPSFLKLSSYMQTKFLRSIFKGVVGPVDEAGIKHLNHIAKHLVEVKVYGEPRLLGCLKDGKLIILRLLVRKKGSFARYASLCDSLSDTRPQYLGQSRIRTKAYRWTFLPIGINHFA